MLMIIWGMRIYPLAGVLLLAASSGAGAAADEATMRAALVSAATIHVREVAQPVAGPGQVLVRIRYAGVNPADWKSAGGKPEDPTARATLHVKLEPVFVSDAMARDVWRVVERMREGPPEGRRLAAALTASFEEGRLGMAPDAFWSGPRFLRHAPAHIRDAFRAASIVVFKGDANYRRVVGDAMWPPSAPFAAACSDFGAPLVCLRTMKSDPVLGLPNGLAERLDAADPLWRIDARRGLVQTWVP